MPDKALPNWVKVDKKRFNGIKNQTPNAKNNNLQARPNRGSPISLNELHKLKTQSIVKLLLKKH